MHGGIPDYATAPVSLRPSGALGRPMGSVDGDRAALSTAAARIRAVVTLPDPPARCGRLPPIVQAPYRSPAIARALCYQRAALIEAGLLDEAAYARPGEVGRAAIDRLQRALRMRPDGDWGRGTNEALEALLGFELRATRKWLGDAQPADDEPLVFDEDEFGPEPEPEPAGGLGGSLLLALAALGALVAAYS